MQPHPFNPSLAMPLPSRTYQVQTDTSTRVRDRTVSNSLTTTLRQTYHGRTKYGTEAVFIELLDFRNMEQVEDQWQGLRPRIVQKYGRTPEGKAFIDGFEQRLKADTLLDGFRHKGAYGVLFPGLFGPAGLPDTVQRGYSERLLTGFFGSVDLPLRMHSPIAPAPLEAPTKLRVTGEVDESRFDDAGFQTLVKQAMDMLNFRVVRQLNCQEEYDFDASGWLTAARQELTFTVDNFYHQHIQHELTLV